jgi:hypothetical protein
MRVEFLTLVVGKSFVISWGILYSLNYVAFMNLVKAVVSQLFYQVESCYLDWTG